MVAECAEDAEAGAGVEISAGAVKGNGAAEGVDAWIDEGAGGGEAELAAGLDGEGGGGGGGGGLGELEDALLDEGGAGVEFLVAGEGGDAGAGFGDAAGAGPAAAEAECAELGVAEGVVDGEGERGGELDFGGEFELDPAGAIAFDGEEGVAVFVRELEWVGEGEGADAVAEGGGELVEADFADG